jgi:hypothetical protein
MFSRSLRQRGLISAAVVLLLAFGIGESFPFGTPISQPFSLFGKRTHQKEGGATRNSARGGSSSRGLVTPRRSFAKRFDLAHSFEVGELPTNVFPEPGLGASALNGMARSNVSAESYSNNIAGLSGDIALGYFSPITPQFAGGNGAGVDCLQCRGPTTEEDEADVTSTDNPSDHSPKDLDHFTETVHGCPHCSGPLTAQDVENLTSSNYLSGQSPNNLDYSTGYQCGFDGAEASSLIGDPTGSSGPADSSQHPVPESPTWLFLIGGALFLMRFDKSRSSRRASGNSCVASYPLGVGQRANLK